METLEELKNKYKKLQEQSNNLHSKIKELERRNVISKFNIGDCYLDTKWNDLIKIVSIKDNYLYYICLSEACITRDNSYIDGIRNWEKITPHQFKDAYLATMKDIQDPDFEEGPESNWNKALDSIISSINKEK
jgi:hypothetical protein